MTLVKADLGTKRICPSCNARFYDLQKRPIECPKCAVSFEPESLYKQRRPRPAEAAEKAPVVREREGDELEEAEESETAEADEAAEGAPEIVALDEDDEAPVEAEEDETETAGLTVVDPAAESAEIEEIEESDLAEEDVEDPALLEEVGDEEDDVAGIIDTDLGKDER